MKTHLMFVAILGAALLGASAHAGVNYTVTNLGNVAGGWDGSLTRPWGINNAGQVVGQSQSSDSHTRVFLWDQVNGIQDLGLPSGGSDGWASGINDRGQITGCWSWTESGATYTRAFLWDNGIWTNLGTLGGPSYGLAVNNLGHVGGYSWSQSQHAFLYDGTAMTDLGTIGGTNSAAFGINDAGQIVGYSQAADGKNHAVLWSGGTVDLGLGTAMGINAKGQVVGCLPGSDGDRAFLWDSTNGTMDLGTLPGGNGVSYANAINTGGLVVGNAGGTGDPSVPASGFHAVLWTEPGQIVDLNDVVSPGLEWFLVEATGINDNGQIIAYGKRQGWADQAFLLTPVPEPATLTLLAVGGMALLRRRRVAQRTDTP